MQYLPSRKILLPFVGLVLTLALTCGIAEIALRLAISSQTWLGKKMRNPKLYADWYSSDDFWKLYYQWDGKYRPPDNPHPLLGWIGSFSPTSYLHTDSAQLKGRRPVLLFGDSFAQCVSGEECFQDILNPHEAFSKRFFLLNYGVGGYGTDQIYLLMTKAITQYENPIVLFSFMTYDLDRSLLSVRTGQKPHFSVYADTLQLSSILIDPDPAHFFATHPAQVSSYFFSALHRIPQLIWPSGVSDDPQFRPAKQALNEKILQAAVQELCSRDVPFVFIVFHSDMAILREDWRNVWLRDMLERNAIPYVWSKDLLTQLASALGIHALIGLQHSHPTTLYNETIAQEILDFIQGPFPKSKACLKTQPKKYQATISP